MEVVLFFGVGYFLFGFEDVVGVVVEFWVVFECFGNGCFWFKGDFGRCVWVFGIG